MPEIYEILKQAREKNGFTIDDLSERTKIRKSIIINIEQGNFEDFQEVYLKAFIRSLAKELKIIQSTEFIEAYKAIPKNFTPKKSIPSEKETKVKLEQNQKAEAAQKQRNKIVVSDADSTQTASTNFTSYKPQKDISKIFSKKPKFNANFYIYSALILFIAIVLFVTFYPLSKDNSIEPVKLDTAKTPSTLEVKSNNSTTQDIIHYFKSSDSLTLKAEALDTVWVNILIDKTKKASVSYLLPHQTYQCSALNEFKVSHGNASKIKFFLNDKPLQPFASAGFIAKDVVITRDSVFIPNKRKLDTLKIYKKPKAKPDKTEFRMVEPSSLDDILKRKSK
jgi:cytoskeletal protein RodZ